MTESLQFLPIKSMLTSAAMSSSGTVGMRDVVATSPEALLLSAGRQEEERAGRPRIGIAKRFGQLEQARQAGGVVVRAVVDAVAGAGPDPDGIHVSRDDDVFLPKRRVTALEHAGEIGYPVVPYDAALKAKRDPDGRASADRRVGRPKGSWARSGAACSTGPSARSWTSTTGAACDSRR